MYCFAFYQGFLFFFLVRFCMLFADVCSPSSYVPGTWHVPRNALNVYLSLGNSVY